MKRTTLLIAPAFGLAACSEDALIDSGSFVYSDVSKHGNDAAASLTVATPAS